ncbi:MAG: tRNA (guanosine(46)-N7)-methyltransferase TrmB [Magnetococcales bacterium]|nr:tRNA (guanosine(46)-N7)-methyltransferase TrmB [Magnetococcales bacterium]
MNHRKDSANPPDRETLMQQARFKLHGRKKGILKRGESAWLPERLKALAPPWRGSRAETLSHWGADPANARLWLEIGFGNGETLTHLAAHHPGDRWIGIDVFMEGISALVRRLERLEHHNVAVEAGNVLEILATRNITAMFDRVIINFPDPWPKKRHHKRRLIQTDFLDVLATAMVAGGVVTLATDWPEYGTWMQEHLEGHSKFTNLHGPLQPAPEPDLWLPTRFQQKGEIAGRPILHLAYRRT